MDTPASIGANGTASRSPIVSVVTIFLNAERFLDEAIRSVLAQTLTSWELLLVDDGSTDRSGAIARGYTASHPDRMRYLTHPGGVNRGMSRSRQLAIEQAAGEFLAFLDADDVYGPEKLARQVERLVATPRAAMVYGPSPAWHGWTGLPEDLRRDDAARGHAVRRLGVTPNTLVEPPFLVRQFLGRAADAPATCGVLVRRRAAEAVGGFEERFTDLFEDQVFFYKICLAYPVFVEGEAWDRYRRHPDSCCEVKQRSGEYSDSYDPTPPRGTFLHWLESHFRSHGVRDRELWRLLRRELWPYRHPVLYRLETGARARGRAVGLGRVSHALRVGIRRVRDRP